MKEFWKKNRQPFKSAHEKHNINFITNSGVTKFEGEGKVKSVVLKDGKTIDTDMVIIGIGVKPATEFVHGINLLKDGSIKVDKHFKLNDDIYAAGDIATFPDRRTGKDTRIEHWRTAEQQGRAAGFNMAGKNFEYKSIPFFWTRQAGLAINYVGHATEWDEIIIEGNVKEKNFMAYFVKENKVLAAAGSGNKKKELAAVNALMGEDKMPSAEEIKSADVMELI